MAVTQYIGSRYVPLFADPIEWSSQNTYEPLTIVLHEGNSYTSKQAVPKGINISNDAFWALTGNYDAQVELYRRETAAAQAAADSAKNDIETLLPKDAFAEDNTVKDYVDSSLDSVASTLSDEISSVQNDVDTLLPKSAFSESETVKDYIENLPNGMTSLDISYGTYDRSYYSLVKITPSQMAANPIRGAISLDKTPNQYARDNASVFVANAGMHEHGIYGVVIRDGMVINNEPYSLDDPSFLKYLDFGSDGTITEYSPYLTANELLSRGATNCVAAYYRLVENGEALDFSTMGLPETNLDYNPRSAVFQDAQRNIYFIAVNGRTSMARGLKPIQLANLCISLGAVNAWNLDGGGSTSHNYQGVKINANIDENGTKDRYTRVMLEIPCIEKIPSMQQHYDANGQLMNFMQAIIMPQITNGYNQYASLSLHEIPQNGLSYCIGMTDTPTAEQRGFALTVNYGTAAKFVLWIPYHTSQLWLCHYANSTWSQWIQIGSPFGLAPVSVTSGDFNTFTTPGMYVVANATAAGNITNIPESAGGVLEVAYLNSADYVRQTYKCGAANTYVRRVRVTNQDATAWVNLNG